MSVVESVALGSLARPGSTPSLAFSIAAPPWLKTRDRLPCREGGSDLVFFPNDYGLRYREEIQQAKTMCLSCPVRLLCLEWATPQADLDGIWGGLTPPERRRLRTGKTTLHDLGVSA